ncbi:MAG TPA: DUF3617 family protein [Casimicrobiaceae bacterium]|jgi:hypothetical protein
MRTKTVGFSTPASRDRTATRVAVACCVLAAASALAAEPPILKSGLWELSRSTDRQPDAKRLTTMCLDDSVQAQMREFGLGVAKELCSKSDRRVDGDRLIIDAVCKLGPTTMTTHSVMTFSGNTAYHTDSKVAYDPPFMNMTEATTSIDGKWVGACLAGQQPGDIKLESGQTINIKSMIRQ